MTTSPPTRTFTTRRHWRIGTVALLVLLLLEGGVRVMSSRLQPVEPWPSTDYTRHENQLAAMGNRVDTLIVGSSTVGIAVRPENLPEMGSGYNYWLAGPPMGSVADLTREILLDRIRPKTLVIGVTMREFNEGPSQRAHHAALLASYAFEDESGTASWVDHVDEKLKSVSDLARYRDVLRDPVALVDQLERGPLVPEKMAADGHLADRGDDTMADEPAEHLQQERDAMVGYSVAAVDVRALDRLLADCDRRDIDAVVVNLPVSAKFIRFARRGEADQAEFVDEVRSVTERHGATWLDSMAIDWDDEWFADVNHLNNRGEARLRPMLAAAFSELNGG